MNFDSSLMTVLAAYTPDKLTTMLYNKDLLKSGKVLEVNKKVKRVTLVSYIFELTLKYSADSKGIRYKNLLLKTCKLEKDVTNLSDEVTFYNRVVNKMEMPPTPLCIDASYFKQYQIYCILMKDLQYTHISLQEGYPLLPNDEQCYRVIETLARFHADWWNNEYLKELKPEQRNKTIQNKQFMYEVYQEFCENYKEWFNESNQRLYEEVFDYFEQIFESPDQNITIIHGDCHFGNVLYPKTKGDVVFIDWTDWTVGNAMDDLAYMFALRYFPQQRKHIEGKMIQLYHEVLSSYGIDYSFEQSMIDYKNATAKCLLIPIFQWKYNIPADIWYYNLERILALYNKANCKYVIAKNN